MQRKSLRTEQGRGPQDAHLTDGILCLPPEGGTHTHMEGREEGIKETGKKVIKAVNS